MVATWPSSSYSTALPNRQPPSVPSQVDEEAGDQRRVGSKRRVTGLPLEAVGATFGHQLLEARMDGVVLGADPEGRRSIAPGDGTRGLLEVGHRVRAEPGERPGDRVVVAVVVEAGGGSA